MIKKLFLLSIIVAPIYSCNSLIPGLTNTKTEQSLNNNKQVSINSQFDPSGGGVIDPKHVIIDLQNSKGKINLGQAGNNFSLSLTLRPPTNHQDPVPPLSGLKSLNADLFIGNTKIPLTIESDKISSDLNYSFEIIGLEKDTQVRLITFVIDKNNEIMGSNQFSKIVSKSETTNLDVLIDRWW